MYSSTYECNKTVTKFLQGIKERYRDIAIQQLSQVKDEINQTHLDLVVFIYVV